MTEFFDIPKLISECTQECNPNLDELKLFELTPDLTNLPSSESLKCYIHCTLVHFKFLEPGSPVVDTSTFFKLIGKMTQNDQDNYLKLFHDCAKRVSKIQNPLEVAYQAMVCGKENSNEVII